MLTIPCVPFALTTRSLALFPAAVARTAVVMTFAGMAMIVAFSVDYMIQLLTSLTKKRALPQLRHLSAENIQAVVGLIDKAAELWE